MKKKCEIRTSLPVTCFTVPIVGCTELMLTSDEIRKCLCAKAEVTEILSDGRRIPLDFSNYDKNNYSDSDTGLVRDTKPIIFTINDDGELISNISLQDIDEEDIIAESDGAVTYIDEIITEEHEEEIIIEEDSVFIPQMSEVKETIEEEPVAKEITAEMEIATNAPITVEEINAKTIVAKTVTASNKGNYKKAKNNNKR